MDWGTLGRLVLGIGGTFCLAQFVQYLLRHGVPEWWWVVAVVGVVVFLAAQILRYGLPGRRW